MASRAKRLWFAGGVLAIAGILLVTGKPLYLVVSAWLGDRRDRGAIPEGHVDDASRMNLTKVAQVWPIPADRAEAEAQLQKLLERARTDKLTISIAGAKHSMGGHTIAPDGIVIDMLPFKNMSLDVDKKLLTVGAGARWSEIIPYLDARGLSVSVMQSNHDFSVGGSLSVNCHGWQCQRPPIASTVEAFRLMKADGTIVRCSRTENSEMFSLSLGGYGLFGIILDAELRVVPNERYGAEVEILPALQYSRHFRSKVDADVGMVYGRLCVVPGENFLNEAIITIFKKAPCKPNEIPVLKEGLESASVRREVFRAQIGSLAGKELRWKAEKKLGETGGAKFFARNQLFHEAADVYQEQNADRSDILHEYFIPYDCVESFLSKARRIVPKHPVDLLNVTIRDVKEDKDTFLRYADRDMFGFVMLFNHPRGDAADKQMEACTQELIDAALECDGRYYLTYRLHATAAQFWRAYPQAEKFFAKKRKHDPGGLFVNRFYLKYGATSP